MRTTIVAGLVCLSVGCVGLLQGPAKAPPIGVKKLVEAPQPVTTTPAAIEVLRGKQELPRGFFYYTDHGGPGGGPRFKLFAVPGYPTTDHAHLVIAGMATEPHVAVWGRQADALRDAYRKQASELGANTLYETDDGSGVVFAIVVGSGTPAQDTQPAEALIKNLQKEVRGYKPLGALAAVGLNNAEWDLPTKEAHCYAAIIALEPGASLNDDAQAALYLELESGDGLLGNRSYGGPKELIANPDGLTIEAPQHGRFVTMRAHAAELGCAKGATTARLRLWTRGKVTNLGAGSLRVALYEKTISKKELAAKVKDNDAAWERARIEAEQQRRADAAREAQRERNRQRDQQAERDRQQRESQYGGGGGGGGGGGASAFFSMTLKSECSRTVKMFIGNKPKFGSGTSTSVSSNSINSYSGIAPQMYWNVDDSENGLSAYTAHAGSQRVRILPSCTGFAPD